MVLVWTRIVFAIYFLGKLPIHNLLGVLLVNTLYHSSLQGIFAVTDMRFEYIGVRYNIRKTSPCNVYPLKPHFYIAKLGLAGVYLFFLFLLKT